MKTLSNNYSFKKGIMESSKNAKQDIMLVRSGNPPNNPNYVGNTFDLDYEWRTLASLEGGEALIRLAEDSPWIEVSFPRQAFKVVDVMNPRTNRAEPTILDDSLIDLLESQGIEVDRSISPNCANGPSDGEIIAAFCLETAGQL